MHRGKIPVERRLILPDLGDANEARFQNVFGIGLGKTACLGPAPCDHRRHDAARRRQIFCRKPDGANDHEHRLPLRSRGIPYPCRSGWDTKTGSEDS